MMALFAKSQASNSIVHNMSSQALTRMLIVSFTHLSSLNGFRKNPCVNFPVLYRFRKTSKERMSEVISFLLSKRLKRLKDVILSIVFADITLWHILKPNNAPF
ncbi:unnamed protein product [Wuchereria bancrofti]|uniref:Uncharacterized protein n=2 Tax=Wuchereria bancrofti TaxID=6293 RepID=A0A3P7E9V2_WUCBA|nr:unnamed protein product [Wuchereria bancrofti]